MAAAVAAAAVSPRRTAAAALLFLLQGLPTAAPAPALAPAPAPAPAPALAPPLRALATAPANLENFPAIPTRGMLEQQQHRHQHQQQHQQHQQHHSHPTTAVALPHPRGREGDGSGGGGGGGGRTPGHDRYEQERAAEHHGPGLRGLYSVSSPVASPGGAEDDAASGSGGSGCSDELAACAGDRTCLSCVSGEEEEGAGVAECLEKYHSEEADPREEEGGLSYCRSLASMYCCGSYEMYYVGGVLCVDEELVLEYWACSLGSNGCSLDDLPCYGVDGLSSILEAEREPPPDETTLTSLTSGSDSGAGADPMGHGRGDRRRRNPWLSAGVAAATGTVVVVVVVAATKVASPCAPAAACWGSLWRRAGARGSVPGGLLVVLR